jgi:hypothetical protein
VTHLFELINENIKNIFRSTYFKGMNIKKLKLQYYAMAIILSILGIIYTYLVSPYTKGDITIGLEFAL